MTDALATPVAAGKHAGPSLGTTLFAIAWRNLWRNRRRTWLTSGGVAFAVLLMMFGRATQDGSFDIMIDNATAFLPGHVQIQHPRYFDDRRVRYTVSGVDALVRQVEALPGVAAVSPRIEAFALASVDERSFGALILGVLPEREFASAFASGVVGRGVERRGEALLGAVLARNLGASVGDELIVLGSEKDGGVAAAAATIVGTFQSGQVELDRAMLQLHFSDAAETFGLIDEAHVVAVLADDVGETALIAKRVSDASGKPARPWSELLPEIEQMIELKHVSSNMIYFLVLVLVTFSVVNSFIMTVFERTREFGMLLAVGMRPGAVLRMLQIEALWMSLLGVAIGIAIASVIIGWLSQTGMYLGSDYGDILEQYQMPDRLYPAFDLGMTVFVGVVMVVAIQFAAVVPGLRVRRMNIVEALRSE